MLRKTERKRANLTMPWEEEYERRDGYKVPAGVHSSAVPKGEGENRGLASGRRGEGKCLPHHFSR